MLQKTFRWLGATLIAFLLLLAAAWPWPAPEVDWRTPLKAAVKSGDCRTARNIVAALRIAEWQSALQLVGASADDSCRFSRHLDPAVIAALPTSARQPLPTVDSYYSLDDYDLGAPRHQYVWLSAFFCAMPYNGQQSIDYVALSEVIPDNDGLVMAAHRARRDICIGLWERTIESLVDAPDRAAKEVAWAALTGGPFSKHADFLYARLLLEQGFVPTQDDHYPSVTKIIQEHAWSRLRGAARDGHAPAVRLLVTLLVQARFQPRDDKKAYFWLLRLHRHGERLPQAERELASRLSETDRAQIARLEEADWRY